MRLACDGEALFVVEIGVSHHFQQLRSRIQKLAPRRDGAPLAALGSIGGALVTSDSA